MRTTKGITGLSTLLGLGGCGLWVGGCGSTPSAPPAASGSVPAYVDAKFERLDHHLWNKKRARWCSLIDLAEAPERAGSTVTVTVELSATEGTRFLVWQFYDAEGKRTLTSSAASCLTQVHMERRTGAIWFDFPEVAEVPAHDASVDAASSADPGFRACLTEYPEPIEAPKRVATVVDTDGTVWTSDGTRNRDTLPGCLGRAHNAWVKAQVESGALPLTAPAVILGTLEPRPLPPPALRRPYRGRVSSVEGAGESGEGSGVLEAFDAAGDTPAGADVDAGEAPGGPDRADIPVATDGADAPGAAP